MEDDTRKLLIGIGQPDFAYRDFHAADQDGLNERWPLLGMIARLPGMRGTPLAPSGGRQAVPAARVRDLDGGGCDVSAFLNAYQPPADRKGEAPAADVRALLDRLAEDLR